MDKHAGRARYDLIQRLQAAEQALAAELEAELEEMGCALHDAAPAACNELSQADGAREALTLTRERLGTLTTTIASLTTSAQGL